MTAPDHLEHLTAAEFAEALDRNEFSAADDPRRIQVAIERGDKLILEQVSFPSLVQFVVHDKESISISNSNLNNVTFTKAGSANVSVEIDNCQNVESLNFTNVYNIGLDNVHVIQIFIQDYINTFSANKLTNRDLHLNNVNIIDNFLISNSEFQNGLSLRGLSVYNNFILLNNKFDGPFDFSNTLIEGDANFRKLAFADRASFQSATFRKTLEVSESKFLHTTPPVFQSASFDDAVNMTDVFFHHVPDFRSTVFNKQTSIHGITVGDGCFSKDWPKMAESSDDADRYRRLKILAKDAGDHATELNMLAGELRADRWYRTKGINLVLNYLYDWTSDFGRSALRPLVLAALVWAAFAFLFAYMSPMSFYANWKEALAMSAGYILPFLAGSRYAIESSAAMFGDGRLPPTVAGLALIEGILGAFAIFLFGLALRNKFRV